MPSIWDLYLDAEDAADLLQAFATVERHRAVREPLPLNDPPRLLSRLRVIASVAAEEALYWQNEAEDRRLEAKVDGGRWGSAATAGTMAEIAEELSDGSRRIAAASQAAAADLARRLAGPQPAEVEVADAVTEEAARRLLEAPTDGSH